MDFNFRPASNLSFVLLTLKSEKDSRNLTTKVLLSLSLSFHYNIIIHSELVKK